MKKLILPIIASLCFLHANAQVTYTLITSGLTSVTFGSGPSEIEVGDIDGDGDLDIATIGDHGSPNIGASEGGIMIWKNNGSGTNWTMTKTGNFGYGGVALGDVNNDNKMDIGYGMHHNNSTTDFGNGILEVALGDGTGSTWTPYDDSLGVQGQNWGMFGVDFGDLNNDGLLDIGANGFGCCDGIWLYKNLGNGKWEVLDGNLGGNSNHQFKMGDFNNDGHLDCASANEWGQTWKNTGAGAITYMQNGIPFDPYMTFDIADVNNDGAKDIAVESAGNVKVYTYDKNSNTWQSISTGLPSAGCEGISLADMDMDGKCDVVFYSQAAITIYKGDGTGNWTASNTIPVSIKQYGMGGCSTGDFNHDGYTDLVYLATPGTGSRKLNVYLSSITTPALNLLPVFPKGMECFVPGSVQFINWLSSVPAGPNATVTIEFSSSGTSGPWTTVVNNAPNSGVYQWTVNAANSPNCYLQFTISNGTSSQVVTTNAFGVGSCATPTEVNEMNEPFDDLVIFPNPMNETGFIQFTMNSPGMAEIKLYDLVGKEIELMSHEELKSGMQRIKFDSSSLTSGIYMIEVTAGEKKESAKLVVAR